MEKQTQMRRRVVMGRVAALVAAGVVALGVQHASGAVKDPGGPAKVVKPATSGTVPSDLLTSGTAATKFTLALPQGASCSGDTATGNFHTFTYVVPSTVDPATLHFGSSGPDNNPQAFPLVDDTGSPVIGFTTGTGSGQVLPVPYVTLTWANPPTQYDSTVIPPGTYNVGIACATGPGVIDKFWNVQETFTGDPTVFSGANAFAWTVVPDVTTTSTSTSTTRTSTTSTSTTTTSTSTTTTSTSTTTTTSTSTTTSTVPPSTTSTSSTTTSTTRPSTTSTSTTTSTVPPSTTSTSTTTSTVPLSTTSTSSTTTTTSTVPPSTTSTTRPSTTTTTSTVPSGPTCNGKQATIVGTPGHDRIFGTPGDDVIVGLGGDDQIYGNGGNDTICGGDGNDVIYGGTGNDWIDGGPGDDRIIGNGGTDTLLGGPGRDRLFAGSGTTTLNGGPGLDYCYKGTGTAIFIDCEVFPKGR